MSGRKKFCLRGYNTGKKPVYITGNSLKISRSCSPLREPLRQQVGFRTEKFKQGPSVHFISNNSEKQTRVMLMVPPFTRIRKYNPVAPLDTVEEMKRIGTPLGLLTVGTAAKKAGHKVKILDAAAEGFDDERELVPEIGSYEYGLRKEEIEKRIREYNPHIIGISCVYSHQWGNVRALCDLIKSINPNIVIVLGGHHASGDYKNALLDSSADYVVLGEGPKTFVELLNVLGSSMVSLYSRAFEQSKRLEDVCGIAYRKIHFKYVFRHRISGELVDEEKWKNDINHSISVGHVPEPDFYSIAVNPFRSFTGKADNIASGSNEQQIIDYSLDGVDLDLYSGENHSAGKRKKKHGKCTYLFTSTGCNTGCGFCTIPGVNGPFRHFSVEFLDAQLQHLKSLGVTEVLIEDDNLFYDPFWLLQVCKLLKKHDIAWVEEGGVSLYSLVALHLGEKAAEIIGEEYYGLEYRHIRKAIMQGIDAETIIRIMADSGCYSVYLAVESANEAALEASGKPVANTKQEVTKEIIQLLNEAGIKVTVGFMLGFVDDSYTESMEELGKTLEYGKALAEAGADYVNPFVVTPLVGTPMGEAQMKFVAPDKDYDTAFSHELGTCFLPNVCSADLLGILRWQVLVKANGEEKVRKILTSGSWPVDDL